MRGGRGSTHGPGRITADKVGHRKRALNAAVCMVCKILSIQEEESSTLPITARPRLPVADHSSFATRSSLLARIARQRVVTDWPCALFSV